MNREEIIRLAREAGWNGIYSKPLMSIRMQEENFLRFATLVAAAEREACAEVATNWRCNGMPRRALGDAIRARGERE